MTCQCNTEVATGFGKRRGAGAHGELSYPFLAHFIVNFIITTDVLLLWIRAGGDKGGWETGTGDEKETTRHGKPTLLYSLSNFMDNH